MRIPTPPTANPTLALFIRLTILAMLVIVALFVAAFLLKIAIVAALIAALFVGCLFIYNYFRRARKYPVIR